MRKTPPIKEFVEGRINRRQLLNGLASAGLVATTLPLITRPARAQGDLTVFTWAEYDNPIFHEAYVEKHGTSPEFSFFGEEEEALQKLRSGFTPDVSHPCTSNVQRWKDAGVLRPIDTSRLDEWGNIFPSFKDIKGVMIDGEAYHMPWDWGNTSILYRTDLVELEEESYSILLDERYKGRMSMFDSAETMTAIAGLLAGVEDPFNLTEEEIDRTAEIMRRIHENLRFYWTDTTQVEQALASGELVASTAWNESITTLKAQGLEVSYMAPKEGILTWVCGLALVKDGPGSEDLAYDYMNAMLAPETGKALIEEFGYGHSNQNSLDLVEQQRLEELGIANAKEALANSVFFDEMSAKQRETMNSIFEKIKAGL
ncbi:extracellular solute-binding protein [Rhodospirillaceae bacterium SYSU D60014]|uniref:ABC transporter substrate-binding protein n=1 Tax=Virgifigura deserti TaxID=2268457 RepID=UPI0013C4FE6B